MQFSTLIADYEGFKTDVYSHLDGSLGLMVRWVQHYGTTSTSSGGANDDVGANDPSQVDDGDGDDAMDE
jgi:hypothetical protein